jgi:spore coat protein U-like protein
MMAPRDAAGPLRRNLRIHVLGAALALASAGALAQSCTVAPGATLAFPVIVALASTGNQATDTGQSLKVACDSGVAGTLRLYSGTARVMSNGAHSLPFNLSLGSGAANNDLSTLSPGASFDITRDGQLQTVILYARIFARDFKSLPAGPYSASITLTVEY